MTTLVEALQQLTERGLLSRVTELTVGDVSVKLAPSVTGSAFQAPTPEQMQQDLEELAFASSEGEFVAVPDPAAEARDTKAALKAKRGERKPTTVRHVSV